MGNGKAGKLSFSETVEQVKGEEGEVWETETQGKNDVEATIGQQG